MSGRGFLFNQSNSRVDDEKIIFCSVQVKSITHTHEKANIHSQHYLSLPANISSFICHTIPKQNSDFSQLWFVAVCKLYHRCTTRGRISLTCSLTRHNTTQRHGRGRRGLTTVLLGLKCNLGAADFRLSAAGADGLELTRLVKGKKELCLF